jgi:hypothetical protein
MIYKIYQIKDLITDKSFYNFISIDYADEVLIEKNIRYNYKKYLNNDKYNKQYISLFKNVNLSYKSFYDINDIINKIKNEKKEELIKNYPKENDNIIRKYNNENVEFINKNCEIDYKKNRRLINELREKIMNNNDDDKIYKLYKIYILNDKIISDTYKDAKFKFNDILKNKNLGEKIDSDKKIYNRNDKITCDICGGKYILCNKSKHLKTKKHIKFINNS